MTPLPYSDSPALPLNLCELLLRDVASLIAISQLINQALPALRPKCQLSDELTRTVDEMLSISTVGRQSLAPSLIEAGALLPHAADTSSSALVTGFTRLPETENPAVLVADIIVNLRLLAHHLELKARLAAEAALLVGQRRLSHALVSWSAEWRRCGHALRAATVRARARAYVADLADTPVRQGA